MVSKKNLTFRLDEEERAWLQKEAERQGRPLSNLIAWIIAQYKIQQMKEIVKKETSQE